MIEAGALLISARPRTVQCAGRCDRRTERFDRNSLRCFGPKRENLYGLLRLLRGEPLLDTVRFGVGAHYPVGGLRSKKLEPLRFPLVLIRQGRILPVRVGVCPFYRSR